MVSWKMKGEGRCKSMPKPKRVNAYLATMQQETDEPTPLATVVEESVSPEAQNIPEACVKFG